MTEIPINRQLQQKIETIISIKKEKEFTKN